MATDTAKQALRAATAPGEAPSHQVAPETRREMSAQRQGERADFGGGLVDPFSRATKNAQFEEMKRLEDSFDQLMPSGAGTSLPTQSGGGVSNVAPNTGGFNIGTPGFNPSLGSTLGGLAGGYGLYSGLKNKNALQAAGGGLQAGSALASTAGLGGLGGALGAVGGPLSLYQGIKTGDPLGIAGGALGTYNSLAALSAAYPSLFGGTTIPGVGSLAGSALSAIAPDLAASLGVGAGAGAGAGLGGGAAAGGAGAGAGVAGGELALGAGGAGAGAAAGGGAMGGAGAAGLAALAPAAPVAVAALGPIIDMLVEKYGLGIRKPTASERSLKAGETGIEALNKAIPEQKTLGDLAQLLNTQWSPHEEVQIGSGPGYQGDDFRRALAVLSSPELVASGQPWLKDFINDLNVKYGQTGAADTQDAEAAYKLKASIVAGLPDTDAYRELKAAYAPGGAASLAEQERLRGELGWSQKIGNPTSPLMNSYDPYTDTITLPDGTTTQLGMTAIRGYNFNPYTYKNTEDVPTYNSSTEGGNQTYETRPRFQGMQSAFDPNYMPTFTPSLTPMSMEGMNFGAGAVPTTPGAGAMDPGVAAAGAGKRSPNFLTPELDNRAEAAGGKLGAQPGAAGDQGIPFGMAGKRQGGGMGVAPQPRPGGGRPGGQSPFGGVPRSGLMPQASGGRPQPNQKRTSGVV